jgi:hypothetical protein
MKGLQPLFLGIFGIFAFSWLGLTVIPNLQIGSLNPQTDEDGGDVYPSPLSGMAHRGAEVYAANGCVYCHSQQVRPDYGGSDIERKWGERRSAPRDYIFEPIVFLGKMRTGPDLANVGHRPALQEKGAASPAPGASPAVGPRCAPLRTASRAAIPLPGGGVSSRRKGATAIRASSRSPDHAYFPRNLRWGEKPNQTKIAVETCPRTAFANGHNRLPRARKGPVGEDLGDAVSCRQKLACSGVCCRSLGADAAGGGILSSSGQFGTLFARRALCASVRLIVNTKNPVGGLEHD